jgi:hypothetical protein
MTPPSRSDDDYDATTRQYEPSEDEDNLVEALSTLSETKIAAALKRLNMDMMKQEARKCDQVADKAETTDGPPARFSRAMTPTVLPSRYVKVSTGLTLRSASCTGSKLGNVKIIIPKTSRGKKLHDRQKTKKIITIPLSPKIAGINIAKILSLPDSELYDIAEDTS